MKLILSLILLLLPVLGKAQLATPNADGLRYGHVHLTVTDVAQHTEIWTEHFNARVAQQGSETILTMPNMMLVLSQGEPSMGSRKTVMDHFGFKVRNLVAFKEKWQADGREMGRVFTGAESQTNAYVMLPDDVYVELQEDQALHEEVTGYHVHFYSMQHEELLAWYTEIFELEVRPRGSIGTTTNVPGMNLSFSPSRMPRLPTSGSSIDHIGFEIVNLAQYCQRLQAKGIEFAVPYRENAELGLAEAVIIDPQGVRIELTEGLNAY